MRGPDVTLLVCVHLGPAPGQYAKAFDGCSAFKRQLRSVLATPDRCSLLTISDHGTMWIEAMYMSDVPGAECWANRAEALVPEIWSTLTARRMERAR